MNADKFICQSCGVAWTDHLGIVGTCAENKRLREKVRIYESALNDIASWEEGQEVNQTFDEPYSAEVARNVLLWFKPLGEGDKDALELV